MARHLLVEFDQFALEIFSWNRQKYTLHGSPAGGGVQVSFPPPTVDHRTEGTLAVPVTNTTREWVKRLPPRLRGPWHEGI